MNDLKFFNSNLEKTAKTTEFRSYGIDLGTTNSTVAEAVWHPGGNPTCRILEIDQATQQGLFTSPLVPSVLAIPAGSDQAIMLIFCQKLPKDTGFETLEPHFHTPKCHCKEKRFLSVRKTHPLKADFHGQKYHPNAENHPIFTPFK